MGGGRARWKIENETFNTLKNQGYHFEHNFGHGEKNLSVVLLLAFLVDQAQQLACPLFQAVLKKEKFRIRLWEHMRALFYSFEFTRMEDIFRALLYGFRAQIVIQDPPWPPDRPACVKNRLQLLSQTHFLFLEEVCGLTRQ